ncbi:MAG TPA: hypothetical protein VEA77_04635 [Hyphomicrobium sp.]|nr:hypothetical protein [Hyphomicrobium sp.]
MALSASSALASDENKIAAAPDKIHAMVLIRSTFGTVNDANLTSNYSVLRDSGSPEFRATFSTERLAATFQILRERKIDLALLAVLEPVVEAAILKPELNVIQFEGHVPTTPDQIRFKFSYQFIEGRWKVCGVDIKIQPPGSPPIIHGSS